VKTATELRIDALAIWRAAVDAVRPQKLLRAFLAREDDPLRSALTQARRILVVGAGKAGTAMSEGVENALAEHLDRLEGIVNVPDESVRSLHKIVLNAARPVGSNQPTAAGVDGALRMLEMLAHAGPDDIALCLLSGGGSALLPAPVPEVGLADKQQVTLLLHACGATINEMNAVRKHLSLCKGGRMAQSFRGRALFGLILSDVIGDPLDVIASGPTAADPTTFADALTVLEKYQLLDRAPRSVCEYLRKGMAGEFLETLKELPKSVHNVVLGNNALALSAAQREAEQMGYHVQNLGSFLDGETSCVAEVMAALVRSVRKDGRPLTPPACLLSGGETTVTLSRTHGTGGRNQEFALAMLVKLGKEGLQDTVALCGGSDGEDGPTDAAGAFADGLTCEAAERLHFLSADFLKRHDAYPFFEATNSLLKTGLTQTNVMDIRVVLLV
jgi:hydroxypyruvate reductase/glycerate 2-kinase